MFSIWLVYTELGHSRSQRARIYSQDHGCPAGTVDPPVALTQRGEDVIAFGGGEADDGFRHQWFGCGRRSGKDFFETLDRQLAAAATPA